MEFILVKEFNVKPLKIYNAWLNSKEHTTMTGGEAKITPEVNATFTAWDGYIEGKNLELQSGKYIKQSW